MPNLITQTGRALYGARWVPQMADDLGVAVRTVRRWGNGQFNVPEGIWFDLLELIGKREKVLADLGRELAKVKP